jgi:hypothetical protein
MRTGRLGLAEGQVPIHADQRLGDLDPPPE